jgi:hypothetical protein
VSSVVDSALPRTGVGPRAHILCVVVALGCSHARWPDEPGVPVELSLSQNADASDSFLVALTSRRHAANLPSPVSVPRYQDEIRAYAGDLQTGKISAAEAEREISIWGRARYAAEVRSYVLDCSARANMPIPRPLVELPTAVISYAPAQFRPRSMADVQCAILLVAVVGSQSVTRIALPPGI